MGGSDVPGQLGGGNLTPDSDLNYENMSRGRRPIIEMGTIPVGREERILGRRSDFVIL